MAVDRTDVQGNVLRGYPHPHVAYIFLRISDKEQAREALGCLVSDIAHDGDWVQPPPSRINVAFTHSGLVAIGVTPDTFARFPEFADGMRARAGLHLLDVGANAPEHWQPGLRNEADVLLTIYGATAEERAAELARVEGCLASGGTSPVLTQLADCLPGGREHFGFYDGFSQPAFVGSPTPPRGQGAQRPLAPRPLGSWRPIRLGEFVLGHVDEDGVIPGADQPILHSGTFMVWRKLQQHVARFERWVRDRAGDDLAAQQILKARIVGRWPDGTSLIRRPPPARWDTVPVDPSADAAGSEPDNSFTYAEDPSGVRCPIGAHARRANPRTGLGFRTERTRRHRIIRRGVPYGPAAAPAAPHDVERGLIFVCFNASITRQFELIQRRWLMDGDTFGLGDDADLLTGLGGTARKMTIQGDRRNPPQFLTADDQFVTTRGGYYLFVPGIAGLHEILGLRRGAREFITSRRHMAVAANDHR